MTQEKQITEITLPSGRYLVVAVPKDTVSAKVYDKESLPLALMVFIKDEMFTPGKPEPIWPLPEGNWQLIGTADKITEQEWKGVVKKYHVNEKYEDYLTKQNPDSGLCGFFNPMVDTATESGHSLIRSHGFEIGECVVLKDSKQAST